MADKGFTEDAILGGALTLRQPKRGHRVGHDAVLLAAATPARSGEHAVEFGAGVGAAGLALARRVAGLHVTLLDIDSELVALAAHNIESNRLSARVRAITLDVSAPPRAFTAPFARASASASTVITTSMASPARPFSCRDSACSMPTRIALTIMPTRILRCTCTTKECAAYPSSRDRW